MTIPQFFHGYSAGPKQKKNKDEEEKIPVTSKTIKQGKKNAKNKADASVKDNKVKMMQNDKEKLPVTTKTNKQRKKNAKNKDEASVIFVIRIIK